MQFCRVPSQGFTQAPVDTHLAHVCPFTVRSPITLLRGFSWQRGINHFVQKRTRDHTSGLTTRRIYLPGLPTCFNLHLRSQDGLPFCVTPSYKRTLSGTGILTCFPSTTPFGLALGADSPCADERCAGTLGLSARRIFTSFIVTHVSIRTSDTSSIPPGTPSQAYRTLLYRRSISFEPTLRPPFASRLTFGCALGRDHSLPKKEVAPVSSTIQ